MTKTLRALALASAVTVSVGLASCGSDSGQEAQQQAKESTSAAGTESGGGQDSREVSCSKGSSALQEPLGPALLATPALDSSETVLQQRLSKIKTAFSEGDVEWSDTEYIVGWTIDGMGGKAPETLDNVQLLTSDDRAFHGCEKVEASSVERIEGGSGRWATYRVTFPRPAADLGYGRILIDNPYAEPGDSEQLVYSELWNLSNKDVVDSSSALLLQATIDPQSLNLYE